jgi:hypothetical protein
MRSRSEAVERLRRNRLRYEPVADRLVSSTRDETTSAREPERRWTLSW